jgi:hypothetical protein
VESPSRVAALELIAVFSENDPTSIFRTLYIICLRAAPTFSKFSNPERSSSYDGRSTPPSIPKVSDPPGEGHGRKSHEEWYGGCSISSEFRQIGFRLGRQR